MRSTIALTSAVWIATKKSKTSVQTVNSRRRRKCDFTERTCVLQHFDDRAVERRAFYLLWPLVQSTSFGCDALILIRFPFFEHAVLILCCKDFSNKERGSFGVGSRDSGDTTRQTEDDIHLIVCGVSLYAGSLASNERETWTLGRDGTFQNAAAIIRGCIDFVMSYSPCYFELFNPWIDGGIAGGNNTSRGTSTCCQDIVRLGHLRCQLSVRPSSWISTSSSSRSPYRDRSEKHGLDSSVSSGLTRRTMEEENQRSKKRFKRAFKKIKGLSLWSDWRVNCLRRKIGWWYASSSRSSCKKSRTRRKEVRNHRHCCVYRHHPRYRQHPQLGEDEDLTEETTLFRKSKLLLLRAIRQLTSLMREVTPRSSVHIRFCHFTKQTDPHIHRLLDMSRSAFSFVRLAERSWNLRNVTRRRRTSLNYWVPSQAGVQVCWFETLHCLKRYNATDKKTRHSNLSRSWFPKIVNRTPIRVLYGLPKRVIGLCKCCPSKKKPKTAALRRRPRISIGRAMLT